MKSEIYIWLTVYFYLIATVAPKSLDSVNQIRQEILQTSNFYRQFHGITLLTLDEQMNNVAQEWANKLASTGKFSHRPSNKYGENLYATSEWDNIGYKAVESWYNEIRKYHPGDSESRLFVNTAIHHMTQLLWKSSSKLGVGVAKYPNGIYNYVVVCNYDPPGNWQGQFKKNLPYVY